jgi:hypothetical protein
MITFRDPPPLQVRVESLKEPVAPPPKLGASIGAWVTGMLMIVISVSGVIAISNRNHDKGTELLAAALANTLPQQAERGVLRVLPSGSDMRAVLAQLEEAHATCRTLGLADSVVICLGAPTVRANTYSRVRFRFTGRAGKLTAVEACPTFVHWSTATVPEALDARVTHPPAHDCWRDASNIADNEWTFATLPDHRFTVTVVHGADRVSRADEPTRDTLIVHW